MTTGYDVGSPFAGDGGQLGPICGGCHQPMDPPGNHLSVCPMIPSSAIPAQTIEEVNDMEKKLGEAV